MNDCGCDGLMGRCTFPNCLPEEDQQALANETYTQRAGVIPIRPPEPNCDFGMSPTDRLVDAVVIIAIVVIIFGFML